MFKVAPVIAGRANVARRPPEPAPSTPGLALPWRTATIVMAVMVAAMPSGVNSYLIAVQFNTGQALASNQMTIATACAAVRRSPPGGSLRSRR